MRLGVRVGDGCALLHDRMMRDLHINRCELDEIWSFVGKKQARVRPEDGADVGEQYTFIALADTAKAIVSYVTGKRNTANTRAFISDLRRRVLGAPELSTDGFHVYPAVIEEVFGEDVQYGVVEKHYAAPRAVEAARRYSPAAVVAVEKTRVIGRPSHISTSYVERQNLTLRTQQRRFTRLALGFSKKLENHRAAVALYVAHYNLCRVHEALRITPAMAIGVSDHIWTVSELVEAALNAPEEPEGRQKGPFRVINGGRV